MKVSCGPCDTSTLMIILFSMAALNITITTTLVADTSYLNKYNTCVSVKNNWIRSYVAYMMRGNFFFFLTSDMIDH